MATSFTETIDGNEFYTYGTLDCTAVATTSIVTAPGASKRLMPTQVVLAVLTAGAAGDTVTLRDATTNVEIFKMEVGSVKQGRVQLAVEDTKESGKEEGFIGALLSANEAIEITSDSSTAIIWASICGKYAAS
jgi:hypothetical protein